jgi:hypothetical protein
MRSVRMLVLDPCQLSAAQTSLRPRSRDTTQRIFRYAADSRYTTFAHYSKRFTSNDSSPQGALGSSSPRIDRLDG